MRGLLTTLCLIAIASSAGVRPAPEPAQTQNPEFINLIDPWPYPFSSAVRTGNLVFASGQIGTRVVNGQPQLVSGGIEPEARQALDNMKTVFERAGTSMGRVVKCTAMLADMTEWPKFNEVYATYFPGPKPARSAFGATALALNARVEIECIAAR